MSIACAFRSVLRQPRDLFLRLLPSSRVLKQPLELLQLCLEVVCRTMASCAVRGVMTDADARCLSERASVVFDEVSDGAELCLDAAALVAILG